MKMQPPILLAFDTTAAHCAAALLADGRIVSSRHEEMGRGQAERLFPMLEEILAAGGVDRSGLDAIGVGIGPGNFTGIRIGVSAARGLALSLGIPAVGVSAFEVLMAEAGTPDGDILVSLEAPRGQSYVQRFTNGRATGEPALWSGEPEGLPPGIDVLGFDAGNAARATGGVATEIWGIADWARHVARVAERRLSDGGPTRRPAPLYVRPADALPPSEPAPVILP